MRVPWTARSNQSILKEINPEYSLDGLLLKLKLQYFGHLMRRADSLEKTLMLAKIEGRRRGQQKMRWLDGISDFMDMNWSKLKKTVRDRQGRLVCCSPRGCQELDTRLFNNSNNNKFLTCKSGFTQRIHRPPQPPTWCQASFLVLFLDVLLHLFSLGLFPSSC